MAELKDKTPSATYKKSARIISDYQYDMIFEQPREGLLKQEFKSYEALPNGDIKMITVERKFHSNSVGYDDTSRYEILKV
jgi:hypothetical protein